jgi:hypothetical protein
MSVYFTVGSTQTEWHGQRAGASATNSVTAAEPPVDEGRVWMEVEVLIQRLIDKPPPGSKMVDPDWMRLFRFCEKHRNLIASRVRARRKIVDPGRLDLWLRQLASPPPGRWGGVRYGLLPLIRATGIPPRSEYELMFTDTSSG